MVFDRTSISAEVATELLRRFLGGQITVTGMRRLHGGMVHSVLELVTDGDPPLVVAKLSGNPGHQGFEHERRVLDWYRRHTDFPVPEPYGCDISGELFGGSCLMMERLPGVNLGEARLDGAGRAAVERQMAGILARLHKIHSDRYGSALEPAEEGAERWLDRFGPRIWEEFEAAAERLSVGARRSIVRALEELEEWLPEFGSPTLVHGDLWATNIVVDPASPAGPVISGFVDGSANYSEVEYELAYLLVFRTVGSEFFRQYSRFHPIRDGFEARCRIYWLHTMMLHVRVFGDQHYVRACENLARELERLRPG